MLNSYSKKDNSLMTSCICRFHVLTLQLSINLVFKEDSKENHSRSIKISMNSCQLNQEKDFSSTIIK